jgi:sugar lactone lactonase YvrE
MSGPDRKLDTLVGGGAFFECPRWRDGRLWVSDYWRCRVLAISPDGTTETVAEVPGSPSGLGWLPDGTLLVASMLENRLLRVENGATTQHADLSAHSGGQSNDLVVDAAGRAYVSTIDFMAFDDMPATNLVRVDPDGSVTVAAGGMSFPNGSAITPDGSTLIVAESWAQRLTAFDLRPDGSLANRRDWARFGPPQAADPPGQPARWRCAPDGIALDAEGAVWVADAAGKRAVRVREGGEILDEIGAGDLDVVACALGGDDGRTLFLCATPDFRLTPEEAARTRPARILACGVDAPGVGGPWGMVTPP